MKTIVTMCLNQSKIIEKLKALFSNSVLKDAFDIKVLLIEMSKNKEVEVVFGEFDVATKYVRDNAYLCDHWSIRDGNEKHDVGENKKPDKDAK